MVESTFMTVVYNVVMSSRMWFFTVTKEGAAEQASRYLPISWNITWHHWLVSQLVLMKKFDNKSKIIKENLSDSQDYAHHLK